MSQMVLDIPLDKIRPFAGQPRKYFSPDGIKKLGASVKKRGQETPGTVRRLPAAEMTAAEVAAGIEYELIDGERRYRACRVAGVPTFRAIVHAIQCAEDQFEKAVVSNFGREGHPPMEIAAAIKRLRTRYTLEETAERLAKSVPWVCQYQSLLTLDEKVQAMLDPSLPEDKQLRFTLAVRIAQIPDPALQVRCARHIVDKKMNAKQAALYLHRTANQSGVAITKDRSSGRDAHTDGRSIERFIRNLEIDSEMILSAKQIDFAQALGGRTYHQLNKLIAQLEVCIENVTGIRDSVKAVYEGRSNQAKKVALQRVLRMRHQIVGQQDWLTGEWAGSCLYCGIEDRAAAPCVWFWEWLLMMLANILWAAGRWSRGER